jgi:hypothetical protein
MISLTGTTSRTGPGRDGKCQRPALRHQTSDIRPCPFFATSNIRPGMARDVRPIRKKQDQTPLLHTWKNHTNLRWQNVLLFCCHGSCCGLLFIIFNNDATLCLSCQQKEIIANNNNIIVSDKKPTMPRHPMFFLVALQGIEQGYALNPSLVWLALCGENCTLEQKAHNNNLTMLSVAAGHIGQFCHGTQLSRSTANPILTKHNKFSNNSWLRWQSMSQNWPSWQSK